MKKPGHAVFMKPEIFSTPLSLNTLCNARIYSKWNVSVSTGAHASPITHLLF